LNKIRQGLPAATDATSPGAGWMRSGTLAALASLLILALFWPTAWAMVEIWWHSETFTHGFLVLPITIWLIWHRRQHVAAVVPAFSWIGFGAFLIAALVWLAGYLADVRVVAQFGLVGMLIGAVWAIVGSRAAKQMTFPLAFLFFAVPVGEALILPLMEFTADFTVGLLRLTGIPVYRDGLSFSIPSGNWSVVEGCSGIRYIIASLTLGVIFAYLTYQSWWRRVAFIVISGLVPILANGLRAYLIVMIGHLSDMKLAHGVDHLIYGWVFFGFVMLILFSIGTIWREPELTAPAPAALGAAAPFRKGIVLGTIGVVLGAVLVRVGAEQIAAHHSMVKGPTALPTSVGEWSQVGGRPWAWSPVLLPAELGAAVSYQRNDLILTVDVAHFVRQSDAAEAVNVQNKIWPQKTPPWRVVAQGRTNLQTGDGGLAADTFMLRGPKSLMVWRWYRIGARYTANPYIAKLYQALDRLTLDRTDGAIVMVAAPVDGRDQPPEAEVQEFVRDFLPALSAALDASVGE